MTYSIEIEIDKPRSEVTKLFGIPENMAYWQPGFLGVEHLSGEAGKPGEKSRLTYQQGKGTIELIETLEVDNLPEEFTATYDAKGMHIRVGYRFEEIGENKTRLISDNDAETSGLMMKIVGLLMPGCFKKQSAKYLENFKAFVETGADVRNTA